MKILLTFTVINLITISASIDSSNPADRIHQIELDSKSNRYLVVIQDDDSNSDRLYKYNDRSSLLWKIDFYRIWKILINKQDDVYVFSSDILDQEQGKQAVWLLKSKSDAFDFLFEFDLKGEYKDPSYFIDRDGYIFFNTNSGVAALQPNKTEPVWIINLEKFSFDQHDEDGHGNVYLTNSKNSVAIITQESKRSKILSGRIISDEDNGGRENLNNRVISSGKLREKNSGLRKLYIVLIVIAVVFVLTIIAAIGRILYVVYKAHSANRRRTGSNCDCDHEWDCDCDFSESNNFEKSDKFG